MVKVYTLEDAQKVPMGWVRYQIYNSLDTTGTLEVYEALAPRLDPQTERTYKFERALQAPAMAMMRRGVRVDTLARTEAVTELKRELARDLKAIAVMPGVGDRWDGQEMETGLCAESCRKDGKHTWQKGVADTPERVCESCGTSRFKPSPFNPGSPPQCARLFYKLHGIPIHYNKTKKASTDDDCLLRIGQKYPKVRSIVEAIQNARDKGKQIGFLNAKLSPLGRFHSSFNIGAAWTGRQSSSKSPTGIGGNLQNVGERHRYVFVADPGYEMFYADLKQAESLDVAYESGDEGYIEAHQSGDVHTYVTRIIWPDHDWTGDIERDTKLAKSLYPEWDSTPGHDLRFQSKGIQHGSNYGLTPYGVAMRAKIPVKAAKEGQARFFDEFPHIRAWQAHRRQQVQDSLPIVSPLGRRIRLFGRPWDEHTQNQGLAASPQGMVADILDIGMYRIWAECDPHLIQLLAQVHDALLGQYPKELREQAITAIYDKMQISVKVRDIYGVERVMQIPVEIAVGKSWGKYNDNAKKGRINLTGLREV